ncbi:hypothetical protein CLV78_104149 [Aliiruegeria haliotis]|uniref:DUF2125 domain-containing protein n=1 Tax=Aliiruegeria haliotis TaxID=1280846 RepID=A0A2T0RR61_9RHOB|nr:DUF2125 domain-containing protein [Aliiruegeria haliotis]PRY23658.1 hypothetical protein CLV78_104149 [Aliiruegeria haliotis]
MKPIRLLWLAIVLALAWSAWWGWGAWHARAGLTGWMEERRAAGWQAEWSDISVQGFPTRIDRTITDLTLANTEYGWVWSAPFFQILGLNYEKDHVILVWPDTMTVQTTDEKIAISGDDLQGSVTFVPGSDRQLETATLVFEGLKLRSDAGWTSSLEQARIATRPDDGREGARDIGVEITGLKPRAPMLEKLAQAGLVPAEVERLTADLSVQFDRPWDKAALEGVRPQPQQVDIRNLGATWGALEVRIAGDVSVSPSGQVSGEVMVKATNWRDILEVARQSGALPDSIADPIESALLLLSGLAGRSETLDIPLTFSNGRTKLGPVPIGPAPTIRIP